MKLDRKILVSLIQEEISKSLIVEKSVQEAVESMQNSLSRMMGEMNFTDPNQLDPIYQQAKQNLEPAANRSG